MDAGVAMSLLDAARRIPPSEHLLRPELNERPAVFRRFARGQEEAFFVVDGVLLFAYTRKLVTDVSCCEL